MLWGITAIKIDEALLFFFFFFSWIVLFGIHSILKDSSLAPRAKFLTNTQKRAEYYWLAISFVIYNSIRLRHFRHTYIWYTRGKSNTLSSSVGFFFAFTHILIKNFWSFWCAKINILLAPWRQRSARNASDRMDHLKSCIFVSRRGLNCLSTSFTIPYIQMYLFYISQDLASWSNLFQLPNVAAINDNNFAIKAPKIHLTQKNRGD